VLAFYRSEEHANEALHELRKNHYRRSAAAHRSRSGELKLAGATGFFGVRKHRLRRYARFVLPRESLVVVEETHERVGDVIALLRHIAHPAVFSLRPEQGVLYPESGEERIREPAPLSG